MLTTNDRCDRCGAQAYAKVDLVSGLGLLFCAHHFNRNEAALSGDPQVREITDERARLAEPSATG